MAWIKTRKPGPDAPELARAMERYTQHHLSERFDRFASQAGAEPTDAEPTDAPS